MSLPQGINFRSTAGFVADGANENCESEEPFGLADYPRTTPQGNTVGWESSGLNDRDDLATNDRRLAGRHSVLAPDFATFRIDLPSAGNYNIQAAAGYSGSAVTTKLELLDSAASLGTLWNGSTGGANAFFDATGAAYDGATLWAASATMVAKTFATTILRAKIGNVTDNNHISHLYVEAAAAASFYIDPLMFGAGL